MCLQGKVALVTGAARHIGLAIAQQFVAGGALVAINDVDADALIEAAVTLQQDDAGQVLLLPGDVSDPDAVAVMFAALRERFSRIDILVNNACHLGVGGGSFLDVPLSLWEDVFAVNVRGMFLCAQHAARLMAQQGGGVILNISSNTAAKAVRGRSAYIASKGAIEAATRAMALDLAPHGIRVNVIAPGYVYTTRWDVLPDGDRQRRRDNIPLGQEADAEDVAEAALFFASDAARSITGARLVIDGGVTVQLIPPDADV